MIVICTILLNKIIFKKNQEKIRSVLFKSQKLILHLLHFLLPQKSLNKKSLYQQTNQQKNKSNSNRIKNFYGKIAQIFITRTYVNIKMRVPNFVTL